MVQRIGGFRRKTRYKFGKNVRQKGKISLTNYFAEYKEGDKVLLHAEPAVQKGIYFPRFHGKVGIISGKKARCYEVDIKDFTAKKTLIIHPVHLKRI